MEGMCLKR